MRLCVGLLILFGGIGLLGWQVFYFLKTGIWESVSMITAIAQIDVFTWAKNPKEWLGLWKVFDFIPMFLFMVIIGSSITVTDD